MIHQLIAHSESILIILYLILSLLLFGPQRLKGRNFYFAIMLSTILVNIINFQTQSDTLARLGVCYSISMLVVMWSQINIFSNSDRKTLFVFFLSIIAIGFKDIRILFSLWFIANLGGITENSHNKKITSNPRLYYLFFSALWCFIALYDDYSGFYIKPIDEISLSTSLALMLFACANIFPFPFHREVHNSLKSENHIYLMAHLSPLSFLLPLMVYLSIKNLPHPIYIIIPLLFMSLSFYLLVTSFHEKRFNWFLYYISSGILLLMVNILPFLSYEGVLGVHFLIENFYLGFAGMLFCLRFFQVRYGVNQISHPYMGLRKYNKSVANLFVVFVFILSNAPLTLAFVGEDIMIYDMFSFSPTIGLATLFLFSLVAISLFRFYGLVFCGQHTEQWPRLKMIVSEKFSFGLLVFIVFFMPILHLF